MAALNIRSPQVNHHVIKRLISTLNFFYYMLAEKGKTIHLTML